MTGRPILEWTTIASAGGLLATLAVFVGSVVLGRPMGPLELIPEDDRRVGAFVIVDGGRIKLCSRLDFGGPGEASRPYRLDLRTALPPSKAETVHRGVAGLLSWDRTTLLLAQPDGPGFQTPGTTVHLSPQAETHDLAGPGFMLQRAKWRDGPGSWAVEVSLVYLALGWLAALAWLIRRSRRRPAGVPVVPEPEAAP